MQNDALRIIIIDDNPNIHQDVIKVLTVKPESEAFAQLDTALFGEEKEDAADKSYLPEFQFDTASQGYEGLEKIKAALKEGKPYALAFVDIRMPPGWDGVETIQRIWKVDPDIQIVICTAYSDYSWEETVQQLGMSDNYLILKKPFDYIAIRQLACALTRKWLLTKATKRHTELLQKTVQNKTENLQQSLSLLRATLESTKDAVFVVDLDDHVIDYNQLFVKMWEIPQSVLKTREESLFQEHMTGKIAGSEKYLRALKTLKANINNKVQLSLTLQNGKVLECFSHPHRLQGRTVGQVWSFRDVTDRTYLEKELEYQATHDIVTKLPNRVLLADRLKQAISQAKRYNNGFCVFFMDLDRFKLVNDSLGHEAGDKLLLQVAKRLSMLIRQEDTCSRVGGDEFIMIFPKVSQGKDIEKLARKVIAAFKMLFDVDGQKVSITTSIGISIFPENGKTALTLLKHADLAMYEAKSRSGNQFHFYTKVLNLHSRQRYQREMELREAIQKNEFFLLFQPQFDIDKKTLLAVEALIRWQHPRKGVILPLDFIPAAEESGLIISLGEWVLRATCKQIAAWHRAGMPYIRVAVNVATQQLKQANFAEVIHSLLAEYSVPPRYLELEITENVIITHPDILYMLTKLKKIGIKIVLDDFGTGNSSLNYLSKAHIDGLKIDKAFISNIACCRSDEAIIEAIITMGKSLGFKVLAEGVETQKQINFLKDRACQEVQGFYYSHPVSSKKLAEFVQSNAIKVNANGHAKKQGKHS
ncbi:MAG: EAL domain-containing protein [Legionellaceae bacterium]|nr:EAL domain-containing protein [Legionellaceae bacterium]